MSDIAAFADIISGEKKLANVSGSDIFGVYYRGIADRGRAAIYVSGGSRFLQPASTCDTAALRLYT